MVHTKIEIVYNYIQLIMSIIWSFNLLYVQSFSAEMSSRTYNYDVGILLQAIQYTGKFGDTPKIFWKSLYKVLK